MSVEPVVRIAMWSGPRNISTAMMRSFGARADCAVTDEPFYAAYLAATGLIHPMRDEVVASQPTDWRTVAAALVGPPPEGKPVWYQKHMTHHMLPEFGREWSGRPRQRLPHPRARGGARVLRAEARRFHARRDRAAGAGRALRPRGRPARPRAAGDRGAGRARRSARGCLRRSARALRHPVRSRDAVLAAGAARERRRLGAGLVRCGRAVDRLRAAAPGGRRSTNCRTP